MKAIFLPNTEVFKATFSSERAFKTNMNTASTGTYDHNELYNRGEENQHPMSAIEFLDESLDKKMAKTDMKEMTNLEINEMFNRLFT